MLTIENLRAFGADVDTGLGRCFGNEDFYLQLANMIKDEQNFDKLAKAIEDHDLKSAFEAAHALKGVLGNLSITPIYDPIYEITELLRAETEMDYQPLLQEILTKKEEFCAL